MRKIIQKQITLGPLTDKSIFITCPKGYELTGGGFAIGAIGRIYVSAPVSKTMWKVSGVNPSTQGSIVLQAFAICEKP